MPATPHARIALFFVLSGSLAAFAGQADTPFQVVTIFGGHSDSVYAVAVSPDGKLVGTGSLDKSVRLFDTVTGKLIRAITGPQGHQKMVLTLAFSPDGNTLASGSEDNTLRLWEVSTGKMVKQFGHPQSVACVAFHPNGNKLVTGAADGRVRIFDVAKGTLVKEILAHSKQNQTMIYAVAFHPQLDQIASAGFDGSVKLWNAGTGKLIRQFRNFHFYFARTVGHRDSVFSLAFSPDGKHLATASAGQECLIKIWNLADGSVLDLNNPKLQRPPGFEQSHPGWIYGIRYTSDGKRLVSAGIAPANRGYLAVWDTANGKMLHGEELTLGALFSLALLPGDNRVLVGAGTRGKAVKELNKAYVIQLPGTGK